MVLVIKNLPANAGDIMLGSIPELGRSPGGGLGNPLWYSCLGNPMDGGAWQAMALRVSKSQTQLKRLSSSSIMTAPQEAQHLPVALMRIRFSNVQYN